LGYNFTHTQPQWLTLCPSCFIPGKNSGTHWTGGCLGFRASLDILEQGKVSCLYWDLKPPTVQPVASYTGFTIPASHTCVLGIVFIYDIVIEVHGR